MDSPLTSDTTYTDTRLLADSTANRTSRGLCETLFTLFSFKIYYTRLLVKKEETNQNIGKGNKIKSTQI